MPALAQLAHKLWPHTLVAENTLIARCGDQSLHTDSAVLIRRILHLLHVSSNHILRILTLFQLFLLGFPADAWDARHRFDVTLINRRWV